MGESAGEPELSRPSSQSMMDVLTSSGEALEHALSEREALIRLCVYAWDRARSSGVAERICDGLQQVGVVVLRPEGQRFDPALHEAAGTVDTEDPGLDGLIAETEMVGFADRDRILRAPVVTVYQFFN